MKERAILVNEALDLALPMRHPEVLLESMRCVRTRVRSPGTAQHWQQPPCRTHALTRVSFPAQHRARRYSLLAGGKRVRPALTLAACELVGGARVDCGQGGCRRERQQQQAHQLKRSAPLPTLARWAGPLSGTSALPVLAPLAPHPSHPFACGVCPQETSKLRCPRPAPWKSCTP